LFDCIEWSENDIMRDNCCGPRQGTSIGGNVAIRVESGGLDELIGGKVEGMGGDASN
jgi:hypothetical protein